MTVHQGDATHRDAPRGDAGGVDIMAANYEPIEVRGREAVEVTEVTGHIDPSEAIEFTYHVKTAEGDLARAAARIAEEETTGRWVGSGGPTPTFRAARAEAVRIEEYDRGDGIITVRAPLLNLDMEDEADPYYEIQMLSAGGPILEFVAFGEVALLDFRLPRRLLDRFPGPRWGIHRSRRFVGQAAGEPLIGTILRPCCGLSVEEVAAKAAQAALGGCVLIKDDEKMMNPSYCALEPRVKAVAARLAEVEERVGRKTIYCAHVPARADRLLDAARRAVDWGATGIMFNVILASNPSALRILAEAEGLDVPLYANLGGLAALTTGPRRIDARVIARMCRLCGADYVPIGVAGQGEGHVGSRDAALLKALAATLRDPIETTDAGPVEVRDAVPVTTGGLDAFNLGSNLAAFRHKDWGYAVAPLAGAGVLDHPLGPKAGAAALWQAAEAYTAAGLSGREALLAWAERIGEAELFALGG
jgi:ribulose 1,5-bisphosphate carboxylase large subunit-like protein